MPTVTFRVLEGVDKGRIFRDLPTPVSIGREEGNLLRLNDDRVSRYHARIQYDKGEIILTDLGSTNGTRVNNTEVQIRRLRPGDRVQIGRSQLLFGSEQEIHDREMTLKGLTAPAGSPESSSLPATIHVNTLAAQFDHDQDFNLSATGKVSQNQGHLFFGTRPLPPLPQKMTPAQAARLAELLDFLHRHLTIATENLITNEEGTQVTLSFPDWQRILGVHMLLARYVRAIAEPDLLDE